VLATLMTSCLSGSFVRLNRVTEQEPNDTQEQATKVAVPGMVSGRVGRDGDAIDWIQVDATTSGRVVVELRNASNGNRATDGLDLDRLVVQLDASSGTRGPDTRVEPGRTSKVTINVSQGQVLWVGVRPRIQRGVMHSPRYELVATQAKD